MNITDLQKLSVTNVELSIEVNAEATYQDSCLEKGLKTQLFTDQRNANLLILHIA